MTRKRLRAFIFGPQGAGKSTQGQLLSDWFGVPFLSAGDLFRMEIEEKTSLGKLVKQYVDAGLLAPDELSNAIVLKRLKELNTERGFVLDGFPRNVDQAESLDRLLKITIAIQIKLSDKEAVRRLAGRRQCPKCRSIFHVEDVPPATPNQCSMCGHALVKRDDDNEETIKQRLEAYHFMTEPLASYYRQHGVLLTVNGEQAISLVFEDMKKRMAKLGFIA